MRATHASITELTSPSLSRLSLPYLMLLTVVLNHYGTPLYCFKSVNPPPLGTWSLMPPFLNHHPFHLHRLPHRLPTVESSTLLVHLHLSLLVHLSLPCSIHLFPLALAPLIPLTLIPRRPKVLYTSYLWSCPLLSPLTLPSSTMNLTKSIDPLTSCLSTVLNTDFLQQQGQPLNFHTDQLHFSFQRSSSSPFPNRYFVPPTVLTDARGEEILRVV